MKVKLITIAAPLFLLSFACKNPDTLKENPAVNDLEVNQTFCIILPEKHSDGATWQISEGFDRALIERVKEVWHGPDKGIYFYLKAKKTGETQLHFVKRKFTDTLDNKVFNIKISDKL